MEEILNRISWTLAVVQFLLAIPTAGISFLAFLFRFFPRRRNFFHAVSFHCNFWRTFSYFFYRWNSISGFFKSIVFPFLVSLQRFFASAIPSFAILFSGWIFFFLY